MFATDGVNAIRVTVQPTMARNCLGCRKIDFIMVHYLSVRGVRRTQIMNHNKIYFPAEPLRIASIVKIKLYYNI